MASSTRPISRVISEPLCHRGGEDEDDNDFYNAAGGGGGKSCMPRRRSEAFLGRRHSAPPYRGDCSSLIFDTYIRRWQSDPGYVSLEPIINSPEFQEGSVRPPEIGIRDPLVRLASRAYLQPRHRQDSPTPSHRRGELHQLLDTVVLKQIINPCLDFIGSVFRRSQK